ncbi:Eukaryotic translation initiation factor 5B [Dictyocoela muelleri]|nr:Eukaryotic translation initiation factor 5B [Dictyocoela muelleri]
MKGMDGVRQLKPKSKKKSTKKSNIKNEKKNKLSTKDEQQNKLLKKEEESHELFTNNETSKTEFIEESAVNKETKNMNGNVLNIELNKKGNENKNKGNGENMSMKIANDENTLKKIADNKKEVKSKPSRKGINIAKIREIAKQKRATEEKIKKEKEEIEKRHLEELKRREELKKRQEEERKRFKEEEKIRKELEKIKIRRTVQKSTKKIVESKEKIVHNVSGDLKSPIVCILGHVDTGKTKLLDKLRESDIQGSEAGGITQQIGATYFPISNLKLKCNIQETDLPGILIIDTPGHESFTNLRSRGSSLCDLAILVVDIFHLIENQTLESIEMLRQRKIPFIIALNKIDRLFQWKSVNKNFENENVKKDKIQIENEFLKCLKYQSPATIVDFEKRVNECILKFAEIGINVKLFYENLNEKQYISMVPTSAITGEGLPDLLSLIIKYSEIFMTQKVKYKDELVCTVLEVKEEPGFGTTLDVILSNGKLREGDKICVCGSNGPILTTIRALLTPQPMKELRVKSQYVAQKEVKASLGVKISAPDLGCALAGSKLLLYREGVENEVMEDLKSVFEMIDIQSIGIHVQASTLGSLEALIQFVNSKQIPISSVGIGPLIKKDITKISIMNEKAPEFATMLCFDIKIDKEINDFAESKKVKIFNFKIIYNLIDAFEKYLTEFRLKEKKSNESLVIFPFQAKIIPEFVFTTRPPFIFGVEIIKGKMKINSPVFTEKNNEILKLGKIISIENNRKPVDEAKKGEKIAIKIESDQNKMYGRHFDHNNLLEPLITRNSIDILKKYYRDEMNDEEWRLIVVLKKKLEII